jgi:DNA-binding transcriptional regulator YiaG
MPKKPPAPRIWTPAMSGPEMKAIRLAPPKLTRKKVAEGMGVHANTIARWERDELTITEPMARLFKLICEQAKKSLEPP